MTRKNENPCEESTCEDAASVKVMYPEIVRLYNIEMDSYSVLVSKCNGLIFINGTVITLVTLSLIQLIQLNLHPNSLVFSICITITYILLVFSLMYASSSYLTENLPVIAAENFFNNYHCKDSTKILNIASCFIARHTTKIKKTNFKKSKKIKYSIIFLSLSVLVYIGTILWAIITHIN